MSQIVGLVRQYFQGRIKHESIQILNQAIHDLRIVIQQIILDHFILLPLPQGRNFRASLMDQLSNASHECYAGHEGEEKEHRHYFIKEIITCFEWAEQIKEEIPNDPVTQKILAVDIPILRPFDYGFHAGKPLKHPHSR